MCQHFHVVAYNTAVSMITTISQSPTREDAEESARNAPARYFRYVTIIPPGGLPYTLRPSITNY